jgi:hypothetical protein
VEKLYPQKILIARDKHSSLFLNCHLTDALDPEGGGRHDVFVADAGVDLESMF